MTKNRVGQMAARLIREGRLKSKWSTFCGEASDLTFRERLQGRDSKIVAFVAEGLCVSEIAVRLGLAYSGVYSAVRGLVQRGCIPKPKSKRGWYTRSGRPSFEERNKGSIAVIIAMKKQRVTTREIAGVLRISCRRVRELAGEILQLRGPDIFKPDEALWIAKELCRITGCTPEFLRNLCKRGLIPFRQDDPEGQRIFNQESLVALVKRMEEIGPRKRACLACKTEFVGRANFCTVRCKNRHRYLTRGEWQPDCSHGWRKILWERLQGYVISEAEDWIGLTEAAQRAGLSKNQLLYLEDIAIVVTSPHPNRLWCGRPKKMYAASQMAIIKEVHQQFQKKPSSSAS